MKNYDQSVEINPNPNWSDHPCAVLIISGSGSVKANLLSNLKK